MIHCRPFNIDHYNAKRIERSPKIAGFNGVHLIDPEEGDYNVITGRSLKYGYGRVNAEAADSKLTWAEKKEWEELPGRIEGLEDELDALHDQMAGPDFFRGDVEVIKQATERSQRLPLEIEAAYARWAELDERA